MKIVQVNRLWRANDAAGEYMFALSEMLEQDGHEVIPFAVQDSGNIPNAFSSLYVSPLEPLKPYRIPLRKILGTGARAVYSREARSHIAALADYSRPDVAHLHKIDLHISPSVLAPLARRGVGIVMTIHDNRFFCPSHRAFRSGSACYRCRPFHYGECVRGACMGGSFMASSLCATKMLAHDLMRIYSEKVDRFIAPSWYMADRMAARGYAADRIEVVNFFVDTDRWRLDDGRDSAADRGEYALYFGKLAPHEGVRTLVKAFAALPRVPLKIAGAGFMDHHARRLAWDLGAENIEFVGYTTGKEYRQLLSRCRFLCLPYESPENMPALGLQAFAMGVPVVGSNLGGLPEAVRQGKTGLLAEPGDVESLKETAAALWDDPGLCQEMGREARRQAMENYSSGRHYERIIGIYQSVKKT